jgi:quinol monooxygenase YgiN
MLQISIIARIKTTPDTLVQAQNEMKKIIEPTISNDEGCIRYELFQDREDHTVFYFLETWKSEEYLKIHLESAHLKAYFNAMEGLTESLTITRLTKIG